MYSFLYIIAINLRRRLCDRCYLGDHHMCTGVQCYQCTDSYHDRKPGRGRGREPWQMQALYT